MLCYRQNILFSQKSPSRVEKKPIWVDQKEMEMQKPLKIAILAFKKMAAESQGQSVMPKML